MGFSKPSKIQEKALPLILLNPPQNLIAQAQSGSGKTAAFTLGVLTRVDPELKYPQAICLCPARELALQIFEVVTNMSKFTKIQVVSCVAEEKFPKKLTAQILVGTPGKILGMIGKFFDPRKITVFVLDEADQMLDVQGLRDQSIRIKKSLPENCQSLLFSATFRDDVAEFANTVVNNPKNEIRLKAQDVTWKKIRQYYIDCGMAMNRLDILQQIYGIIEFSQTIIFVNTKDTARETSQLLQEQGFQVSVLTGDMEAKLRDQVIGQFREGRSKVLITTNVLARGIDIPTVELVINYDIPTIHVEYNSGLKQRRPPPQADVENYIHRIGRSGRYDRPGVALNLVYPGPTSFDLIPQIEKVTTRPITPWPQNKILELGDELSKLSKTTEFH